MTKGTGNWGSDQYLACDDGFIRMWVYIRMWAICIWVKTDQITHFKYVQFIYYMSIITQ